MAGFYAARSWIIPPLPWLDLQAPLPAGAAIEQALDRGFENGTVRPTDLGGNTGTHEITDAVIAELKSATA